MEGGATGVWCLLEEVEVDGVGVEATMFRGLLAGVLVGAEVVEDAGEGAEPAMFRGLLAGVRDGTGGAGEGAEPPMPLGLLPGVLGYAGKLPLSKGVSAGLASGDGVAISFAAPVCFRGDVVSACERRRRRKRKN